MKMTMMMFNPIDRRRRMAFFTLNHQRTIVMLKGSKSRICSSLTKLTEKKKLKMKLIKCYNRTLIWMSSTLKSLIRMKMIIRMQMRTRMRWKMKKMCSISRNSKKHQKTRTSLNSNCLKVRRDNKATITLPNKRTSI